MKCLAIYHIRYPDNRLADMNSLLLLQPLPALSSSVFLQNSGYVPSLTSVKTNRILQSKPLTATLLALTESPDSTQSPQPLLIQLSVIITCPFIWITWSYVHFIVAL